jgi:hypothetical protein
MSLILKLVGTNINKEYIIKYKCNGYINIDILINIFKNLKFTDNEISLIKFIKQGTQISNQKYLISSEKEEYIFIFSTNEEIRIKLKNVFEKNQSELYELYEIHNNDDDEMEVNIVKLVDNILENNTTSELLNDSDCIIVDENKNEEIINNSQTMTEEIVNNINEEIVNNINEETLILLKDSDFRILIDIYKRRPELFQKLLHYTHSGDIVYNITETSNVNNYSEELEFINKLNLNFSEDKILEKLIKYKGHINLTLRSLLCEL